MHGKLHVLVASRSKSALHELSTLLADRDGYIVDTRHIENGHADPLWGLSFVPDIVVFSLTDKGHDDLTALLDVQPSGRPPMIVLAEAGDAQTMRLAMQAGARDFLPGVIASDELAASIDRAATQLSRQTATKERKLTVFVNAKGGSGATFLASNVAHVLKCASGHSTALLSLDFQFDSLAQYFDVQLRHGLLEVLGGVEALDEVALDAYMTQHGSGLRLLAAAPEDSVQSHAEEAPLLDILLDKMTAQYDHVVVDVPRRIDPFVLPVFNKATRIVLVVQQTLSHVRDATRMLKIFSHYGVSSEQVLVVVNRFEKKSPIEIEDIRHALKGTEIIAVPSDFKTVAESINLGIPMHDHARGSTVTKALAALEARLGGSPRNTESSLIAKAFSNILRKEKWLRA